jgi:hypothetical protein
MVLHLLRDAEAKRLRRDVFFNGQLKAQQDINRYIAKSGNVSSYQDLLGYLPANSADWPKNVTWQDDPATSTESAGDSAQDSDANIDGHPSAREPGAGMTVASRIPDAMVLEANTSSNIPMEMREDNMDHAHASALCSTYDNQTSWSILKNPSSGLEGMYDLTYLHGNDMLPQTWMPSWDPFEGVVNVVKDFSQPVPYFNTPDICANMLISSTPFQMEPPSEQSTETGTEQANVEDVVEAILKDKAGEGSGPARKFAREAIKCCIYEGQANVAGHDRSRAAAISAFQDLASSRVAYQETVTVLNVVSFVLEIYGAQVVKLQLLQQLQRDLKIQDKRKAFVLDQTIAFIIQTCDWDEHAANNMLSVTKEVWETAVESAGTNSWLAMSAQYNMAWVQLEAGKLEEALSVLSNGRARCETVFGLYSFQTLSWLATQARALFRSGHYASAEAVMTESVSPRTRKAFSENHAVYWEFQYRIGLFMFQLAAKSVQPASTTDYWLRGEDIVRSVLLWRARNLGVDNPRTMHTLKYLQRYLEQQGKKQDAKNLYEWLQAQIKAT